MHFPFSPTQIQRLKELGAESAEWAAVFETADERDRTFQVLEKKLGRSERQRLNEFRDGRRRPRLCTLENDLAEALVAQRFVQVTTPILMSKGLLAKMGIDESHPLTEQVYWVDRTKCLRPMLAPHLYYVVKDLLRLWEKPVGLFEIGPCFRKESQGAAHANEFTMLNLAEFGTPEESRMSRIEELAALVMKTAGLDDYVIAVEDSEVYGDTLDVLAGKERLEVASCAMGPHPLDGRWGITDTWVGLGFGLERLLMAGRGKDAMGRTGRSLTYIDGIRLNV
ncbi:MAG: pyrrolysine--tRNA(Pyl) ligase large subunit [Pseudomonadota bacterium]